MSNRNRRHRSAGFTLVEILVVITIIAMLISLAVPYLISAQDSAKSTVCRNQLSSIAKSLSIWKNDRNKGRWPKESGIRFLLVLARDGMVEEKDMKVFLCPGEGIQQDDNITETDKTPGSAYKDWDAITSQMISYAGRDTKNFPILSTKEGAEVIAADDNEGRANHKHATNFVYADASTDSFDIKDASDFGLDFKDIGYTPVGPDSPLEKFQKLRVD